MFWITVALAAGKIDVDTTSHTAQTQADPCAVQQLANDIDQLKRDATKEGTKVSDSVGCTMKELWRPVAPVAPPTKKELRRARRERRRARKR